MRKIAWANEVTEEDRSTGFVWAGADERVLGSAGNAWTKGEVSSLLTVRKIRLTPILPIGLA